MNADRIRFVTGNYAQLHGLRLVPLGVVLVLVVVVDLLGVGDPGTLSPAGRAQFLTRMGLVFWLALGLALAAPAYYRFRYGSVEALDRRRRNRWISAAVIGFLALTVVDSRVDWPVSLSLLLVSAALWTAAWHDNWIRPYYMAAAVVWLLAGLLPGLGVPPSDMRLTAMGLGGLTLIVIGIGDHILLARSLTPPKSDHGCHPTAL